MQAFTDDLKLKIHYLKHQTTKLGSQGNDSVSQDKSENDDSPDLPQDLSSFSGDKSHGFDSTSISAMDTQSSTFPSTTSDTNTSLADQFSSQLQNLHFAHLASFYQQNPFYYQHLYPFLSGMDFLPSQASKTLSADTNPSALPAGFASSFGLGPHFDLSVAAAAAAQVASLASSNQQQNKKSSVDTQKSQQKRKLNTITDDVLPYKFSSQASKKSTKTFNKPDATASNESIDQSSDNLNRLSSAGTSAASVVSGNGGNFKMFKEEPIPSGYLKFRFNEDCNFPNCAYRNHQSHFHCCRMDCYYSFCDKTRFVQHTARHERLDKLMGDDFKQYRANMSCGHDECAYNKNLGLSNF